jgi:hypothetical protein
MIGSTRPEELEKVRKAVISESFRLHSYDSPRAGFAGCSLAAISGRSLQSMPALRAVHRQLLDQGMISAEKQTADP